MYSAERLNEKVVQESGIDVDWYVVDKTGEIAVVASGGGILPDSVSMDMSKLKKTITYFRSLPVMSDVIIEENVLTRIENYSEEQRNAYLKDLYFMVSRGLYYFDKVVLNDYSDFKYYLKAKPKRPLPIGTISDEIKDDLQFA